MKLLLDTQILIWTLGDRSRLPPLLLKMLEDPETNVWVSIVSIWEMAIKTAVGKLKTPDDLLDQLTKNRFEILPIDPVHAMASAKLPLLHRDPFDRMLVVQAQYEGMTLVTVDAAVRAYPVRLFPI